MFNKKQYEKQYRKLHKEKNNEYCRQYHQKHKEQISKRHREHYRNNREKILKYDKEYNQKHRAHYKTLAAKYRITHAKEIKEYNQILKNIMHNLKINGCAVCGYNRYDGALDFHHVMPKDKKFNIIISRITRNDLADELNKCILLCSNCHREIHNRGGINNDRTMCI